MHLRPRSGRYLPKAEMIPIPSNRSLCSCLAARYGTSAERRNPKSWGEKRKPVRVVVARSMTTTWPRVLWNRCNMALFRGAPDRAAASEYLELARDLGNARALAGALIQSGVSDPDPRRGVELLAQARELTARTRDTYRRTRWPPFGSGPWQTIPEPAIRTLPDLIEQARSTGQRLLLAQRGRDLLWPLAALRRSTRWVSSMGPVFRSRSAQPWRSKPSPRLARPSAKTSMPSYATSGRSFTPADLEEYLLRLVSELS